MDFSKDELETVAVGLDMAMRTEGQLLAQTGIAGIANGRDVVLTNRIVTARSAFDKVQSRLQQLDEIAKIESKEP